MTSLATHRQAFDAPPIAADRVAAPEVEVLGLAEAEGVWRDLERDAVTSPYGRHDWVRAYADAHEEAVRVCLMRDRAGRTTFLLPLTVRRRLGLSIAHAVGGKHANYVLPLIRADLLDAMGPNEARAALAAAGRALQVDALALHHVPVRWEGRDTPFGPLGRPSPSGAAATRLDPNPEVVLARGMTGPARKKLRSKIRGLEKLGPVSVRRAETPAEIEATLAAFTAQKAARFQAQGIADPFAAPDVQRFLRIACAGETPAIELYGLTVGERIVAVLGGAADTGRFSGMVLSFEEGEAARFSPGEVLVTEAIRRQCELGRVWFDLGVGEARYKSHILDTSEDLVDITMPLTLAGQAYATLHGAAIDGKRRLKESPRAMAVVGRLRRILAQARG